MKSRPDAEFLPHWWLLRKSTFAVPRFHLHFLLRFPIRNPSPARRTRCWRFPRSAETRARWRWAMGAPDMTSRVLRSISLTCFHAAFTNRNDLPLNFYFTNNILRPTLLAHSTSSYCTLRPFEKFDYNYRTHGLTVRLILCYTLYIMRQ